MMALPICCVTGRIAGDSDACGDCDPCILGASSVPEPVKRLLKEKDEWREKYSDAASEADALRQALATAEEMHAAWRKRAKEAEREMLTARTYSGDDYL